MSPDYGAKIERVLGKRTSLADFETTIEVAKLVSYHGRALFAADGALVDQRRPRDTPSVGKNAALLRQAFEAFNRAGIDSVLDLMHPEVEVVDLPQVPEERHRRGRAAIAAWFHSLDEIWDRLRLDAEEVTELDRERVLAVVRFSGSCAIERRGDRPKGRHRLHPPRGQGGALADLPNTRRGSHRRCRRLTQ